jgi:hypothetical protein
VSRLDGFSESVYRFHLMNWSPPPGFGPDPDAVTGVPRGAIYQKLREEEAEAQREEQRRQKEKEDNKSR